MQITERPTAGAPAANQYGVFQVHYASPKQVAFIKRLLAERDTAGIPDVAELRAQVERGQVNKKAASAAIELLLAAPVKAPAAPVPAPANVRPASDKQVALIKRLAAEKDTSELTPFSAAFLDLVLHDGVIGIRDASSLIDLLFAAPRRVTVQDTAISASGGPVEGMHFIDGQVIKVQRAVHGSGNLYAKVLNVETERFEYAPGAVNRTSEETLMTKAQASEFGRLYGMCAACAATLTDEFSIERGYGPVCAKRFA